MKVFVFNGMASSGKTSIENEIVEIISEENLNKEGIICSIIDYVKDIAAYAGWEGTKNIADRKFLSQLKDILTEWNDSPFKEITGLIEDCERLNSQAHPKDYIFFIDMRESKDIERMRMYCFEKKIPFKAVIVRRRDVEGIEYGNHADDEVFNYPYDIVIENNGTIGDLADSARTFYEEYIR